MSHWKYFKYLIRHKWFVFVAGLRCGVPAWRLVIHDWSKFLPCEWFPYARFFYGNLPSWEQAKLWPGYGGATKESAKIQFDVAWLHHQHLNPHHWQHWVLREDSGAVKLLEMPERLWREMVADWMGAGRAITGKWEAAAWYSKNGEIIQLAPQTRIHVEKLLAASPPVAGTSEEK